MRREKTPKSGYNVVLPQGFKGYNIIAPKGLTGPALATARKVVARRGAEGPKKSMPRKKK